MEKRGVSAMIGYILLIVLTMVMGSLVFIYLRSYVPSEKLACPDQVEAFINEVSFNNSTLLLTVNLKNSGTFDFGGYFIHATNNSSQETATIDLSAYLENTSASKKLGNSIIFGVGGNYLSSGESRTDTFNVSSLRNLYSVSIIPVRYQEEDNRERFVSCSEAEVKQVIGEPIPVIAVCGNNVREGTEICDGTDLNSQGCAGLGFTGGNLSCFANCTTFNTAQCTNYVCGNGVINPGEVCDDGGNSSGNGCSSTCQVEPGWSCVGQPSVCSRVFITLFSDNFENYSVPSGPVFFSQLATNGWAVNDFLGSQPNPIDDIYLNTTLKDQGVYSVLIQDDSLIFGNISTLGYNNITFNYSRRAFSLEGSDRFIVSWRVGNSGSWTQLESTTSTTWTNQSWLLTGAENKPLVQVRFFLDTTSPGGGPPNGGNTDHGLADNVNITGKVL